MTDTDGGRASLAVVVVGGPALLIALAKRVLDDGGLLITDDPAEADVVVAVHRGSLRLVAAVMEHRPTVLLAEAILSDDSMLDVVTAGATAVLHEPVSPEELVAAVRRVAEHEVALSNSQVASLLRALRARGKRSKRIELTRRERDLLEHMTAGASVKQTARVLGIAVKTVENTQRLLYRKLEVRNRTGAVAKCHSLGLLGSSALDRPVAVPNDEGSEAPLD